MLRFAEMGSIKQLQDAIVFPHICASFLPILKTEQSSLSPDCSPVQFSVIHRRGSANAVQDRTVSDKFKESIL